MDDPRPGLRSAAEQPPDPQGEQQPEPDVRVGERVAEQLASLLGVSSEINGTPSAVCGACVEQEPGSAFLAGLNASPTVAGVRGVRYPVIETAGDDEMVTPYRN